MLAGLFFIKNTANYCFKTANTHAQMQNNKAKLLA